MGEIADMMLDGTMDCETGEWNFDGEDGPGFPMTSAEAAAFRRDTGWGGRGHRGPRDPDAPREPPIFQCSKKLRKRIETFGTLRHNDAYHWQVRDPKGKLLADWWPHKSKYRIDAKNYRGNEGDFVKALEKRAGIVGVVDGEGR